MDILFCDGCDGSISKRDVDEGNVVDVDGHTYHKKCAPGRGTKILALLPWLLILPALAGGVLIGTVLTGSPSEDVERAEMAPPDAVEARLDAVESEVRGLSAQLQTSLGVLEGRMGTAETALGRLDDGLGVVGQDLDRIVDALETVAQNVAKLGSVPEVAAARGNDTDRRHLLALLENVESADFGVRFGALHGLALRPEDEAVRAVRKALTDPDNRIRAYAARLLGERGDKGSSGELVALLRDEIAVVRDAAHRALLLISGMPFEFDAVGPEEKREEQARSWEKWWADHDAAADAEGED